MRLSWGSLLGLAFLFSVQTLGILGQLPLMASEPSRECNIQCPEEDRSRAVCGTDGRTYRSRCEINRARCEGHPVEFKHRGKCPERARCRAQRITAQIQVRKFGNGIFVPECEEDGSYREVQCHSATGYCWCVDQAGKPISSSSVRHKKPNCAQQACSNADRSTFSRNLIDIFKSEYSRIPRVSTAAPDVPNDELQDAEEKQAIQWKFDQLDKNMDNYLKRKEIRDLRRMAKKIVKPRACAKTFTKYCDLDQDKKISRNEWSICLGVDQNISFRLFMSLNSEEQQVPTADEVEDNLAKEMITALKERKMPRLKSDGVVKPPKADNKEDEKLDCFGTRKVAMDHHKQDPTGGIYIPQCTPDGIYEKAQCHHSTGYCWCVIPKTGKPVRGSATHGVVPDCSSVRRIARTFKGCSLQKKQVFLDELIETFTEQMVEVARNSSQSAVAALSQEQAAKWKYSILDANKNESLDKKEWIAFRQEWKSFLKGNKRRKKLRKLRKCWRNFPRFCDVNNNSKITIEEWLICTGAVREARGALPLNHKRRGPNPFSTILKSDD